jgi:hypothetical protein
MTSRGLVLAAIAASGAAACGDKDPEAAAVCGTLQAAPQVRSSQCGPTADFTPINSYQGEIASVQEREEAVVLINGLCTGTLIAAAAGPVVLTAGHCVALGEQAVVAFNIEDNPDGDRLVTGGTVIEQALEPDYALLRLDALPAATAPTPLTTRPTDLLAIIQHPRGRPKVIAEGAYLDACNGLVYYADLDTLVGSSGAGVLNDGGFLLAVHTDGDCAEDGTGSNHGSSAESIVDASPYLQPADLADR